MINWKKFAGKAIASFMLLVSGAAQAGNTMPLIVGAWTETGLMVHGQRILQPDSKSHALQIFTEVGLSHLFLWKDGQSGYCERRAIWSYDETSRTLSERVVAVSPANLPECDALPGMKVGFTSTRRLSLENSELRLSLDSESETVQTLWHPVDPKYFHLL